MTTKTDNGSVCPVSVYLDSRDYSALSNAKRLANEPDLANALERLRAFIKAGKVAVLWSAAHALEMSPESQEAMEPAFNRLNAMFILSDGVSFMDMASIARIERRLSGLPEACNYALGQWLPNSALPNFNLNPAAYVAKAKEHGLDPTAFKSSIAALGVDLTATMTQIRNIAQANPDAFAKENDTNFAQMLFKVFTGASEVPAHALGCRCAGGVMRRLCLVSAKMQREISDSDCADLWHSFYAPYVDVWSGDGFIAPLVRQAWPTATVVSGSFTNVVDAIARKVEERFP